MKLRQRKCKNCGERYRPNLIGQLCCSPDCALEHHRYLARKKREKQRKEDLKSRSDWLKDAQKEFNRFIRARDEAAGRPCVSCGRYHMGQYHAGHYRPVGGRSGAALRFHEDNCHRQCSSCNNYKSGALTDYRIELINRIGIERVEWLEGPHDAKSWTIDELKAIKQRYREKTTLLLSYKTEEEPF